MRKLIYTLMLLLPLSACTRQHTFDTVLAEADQLIESNPDSAYRLLNTIDDIRLLGNDESRALHTLLSAKACWKLYKPGPTDSLMSATVSYYRQQDDQPRLADALYYQAMPLYEAGNHEQALLLLKQGEEIAVNLQDTLLLSKYYESLFDVNYKARYDSLALHYAKLFLSNSLLRNDTNCIARAYSHISTSFILLDEKDSSDIYITRTTPYLKYIGKSDKAFIMSNIGSSYIRSNKLSLAKQYLMKSLEAKTRNNTYNALGMVLYKEGNVVEAKKYWEKASVSNNANDRSAAYYYIYNLYKNLGDFKNALSVYEKRVNLIDSITKASEKKQIAEIQLKYDKTVIENQNQRLLIYLLVAVITVLIITFALWQYRKYYEREIKKYESTLEQDEEKIKSYEEKIANIEQTSNAKELEIQELKNKINTTRKSVNERLGRGMEIYEAVMRGEKMPSLTGDDRCFIEYYSLKEYNRYQKLTEKYEDLSPRPMLYAILQELGKTDDEIVNILSIKKDSLRSLKKRLADKSRTAKIV